MGLITNPEIKIAARPVALPAISRTKPVKLSASGTRRVISCVAMTLCEVC